MAAWPGNGWVPSPRSLGWRDCAFVPPAPVVTHVQGRARLFHISAMHRASPGRPPGLPPRLQAPSARTSQAGLQAGSSSFWLCVRRCARVTPSLRVGLCGSEHVCACVHTQHAPPTRWPCGFGLRERGSRQRLWRPATPAVPGGREGHGRDTSDLLARWGLCRGGPARPAFGTPNPLLLGCPLPPTFGRRPLSSVGQGRTHRQDQPLQPFTSVAEAPGPPLWGLRDHPRHPLLPRCGVRSRALDPAGLGSNPGTAAWSCVPRTSCLTSLACFPM